MAVSSLSASVEAMTWTLCGLWQFSRGISLRKGRPDSVTCKEHVRESDLLERAEPTERNIEDPYLPETPHTGRNILKFALKTLSTISSNIPFGSVLSSVIDPLLDIVNRIEQTSVNTQGLVELAARIELLSPLVSEMARDKPRQGRLIVEALQRELQSMTKDLNDAHSQGKLDQFFNGTDNASSLAKHNTNLTQMIADATLATVHEVLQSLQDLESRFEAKSEKAEDGGTELFGGTGGKGGAGRQTGGEGGLGEAAQLAIENVDRFRRIRGGTGGEGGASDMTGGRGGTGQGPKFSHQLLSIEGNGLPPLTMAEFCQEYQLSDKIHKLLDDHGFETVGALLKLTDTDLENAGFKDPQQLDCTTRGKQLLKRFKGGRPGWEEKPTRSWLSTFSPAGNAIWIMQPHSSLMGAVPPIYIRELAQKPHEPHTAFVISAFDDDLGLLLPFTLVSPHMPQGYRETAPAHSQSKGTGSDQKNAKQSTQAGVGGNGGLGDTLGRKIELPSMSLVEFCKTYKLGNDIFRILDQGVTDL
ncbi:hypothetical protein B0H13DRAFT_2653702 [Mycena leptocephala]|nr:hypothetical protein B0H13DRAFT_2653702 [Mycena leptocephala]